MSTYMRRILVPKDHLPVVANYIAEHFTRQFMIDTLCIGSTSYGVIKAISPTPLVAWVPNTAVATTIGDAPSAEVKALALRHLYASDLDLKAVITDNAASADYSAHGVTTFTYTVTDAEGVASTIAVPVLVVDDVIPIITAANATVDCSDLLTWEPDGTAVDVGDGDLTGSLVVTYFQSNGTTALADLAAFRAYAVTNPTAKVKYNVKDAAGNAATQVVQTITRGADDIAPVITLTATAVNIALADVAAWNETTNVASATDNVDGNIKNNVMYTFHKFDGDVQGDSLDNLAGAKTWLGTAGHKVRVTYTVSDVAFNPAPTVYCVYTAV